MNNVITAYLMGGLGNQLFQIAHAFAQSIKHDRPVKFIPDSHTPGQGRNTKNYVNNIFRKLNFTQKIDNLITVSEPSFEYRGVKPEESNTIFYGYFQSSKNWFGYDEIIREIFLPPMEVVESFKQKYPELNKPNTLSLHVRRSEYLKLSHIHPTVSLEYIKKALETIGDYSHVFIFSDDHEWVKENLNLENSTYVNETEDYLELWLMGLCSNHIISNSTFSWWGTFLNKNENKKIIAPSVWFGPKGPNAKDIYESYWKLINVKYENGFLKLEK